ncbi:hypothetical protein NEIPOLOT_01110, partial [Neisseria polysaccharea ATCC 43768]
MLIVKNLTPMASGEGLKTKNFLSRYKKPLHKKQPPTSPSFPQKQKNKNRNLKSRHSRDRRESR